MYDQLDSMQTAVDAVQDIKEFGYVDTALDTDAGIPGHNEYSDLNSNNIPLVDGTELSLQEQEKGFRDAIATFSRAFFTHFFGRSSFNTNKLKRLFSDVLGTYKDDYTHNFRAWDSTATYKKNDVCFLVAYGIRYCFKSLVNDNTDPIEANADGTLEYDDTKWSLLTEVREVRHPIGKPFLWFGGNLSDNYICFSDGQQYNWVDYPALNTPEFRAVLTRFTWKGAKANDQNFTVPNISELYPMSVDSIPDVLSTIGAKVPAHYHNLVTGTVSTNSTTSTGHTHPMYCTSSSGGHTHYTGDYEPDGGRVSSSRSWREDSKFYGTWTQSGGSEEGDDAYENDYRVYITPKLKDATHGSHSITVNTETHSHSHSGTVTPSGAGDFGAVSGKYRPGTIKVILAVRAV